MKKRTANPPSRRHSKRRKITALVRKSLIIIAFLAVPIAWLIANEHTSKAESDLSVIGSGVPVAVQIHDHSCPLCQRLKANAEEAIAKSEVPPEWRIVDINTTKGADFANQYGVGHVTILLFDGHGNRQETIQGVTSVQALTSSFEQLTSSRR
ncbi:hypothetical protein ELY33_16520 [Vreelandella andesensis]|uniref:Thioredoxin domain-containing protein n=1 Tax=Vreelandella andesensis TaxID=447567 RepID=A0A433KEM1_9GAMM|nr:thioredoxin domain-containing protein [Halomonas andesensis]RUR26714.1 hypothetical protein ELY33_16520 [Halomonas andesensis]